MSSNIQIDIRMLERYFKSPPAFRLETRNISKGWALDGLFAIPEKMLSRPNFAKLAIDRKHPLARLTMALSNGFIKPVISTELLEQKNWTYYEELSDTLLAHKFAWAFNQIDDAFLTSVFPCWIPGDIEALLISALTIFYQYNEVEYQADNKESGRFKISIDRNSSKPVITIVDDDGTILLYGEGDIPLIAAYDLYEKVWMLEWKAEAPSITGLVAVIDIGIIDKESVILVESARSLDSKYPFYKSGRNPKYQNHEYYYGKFKFLEGDYEVFETPIFSKIGSIKALFERMKSRIDYFDLDFEPDSFSISFSSDSSS